MQEMRVLQASLALGVVVVALVAGLVLKPYRDPTINTLATLLLVLQVVQLALALLGYLDVAGDDVVNGGLVASLIGAVGAVLKTAMTVQENRARLCGGRKEEGADEEEVITPAKPEIVRGSSELLPPDVWAPPAPELTEEDEEPITKEAPVKPDEDARGIIGLWFEGNVRARAYRKMGRA